MTTRANDRAGFFNTKPTGEFSRFNTGLVRQLVGSIKDACQGACAGFLGLLGALHMSSETSGVANLSSQFGILDTLWASISANGLAGPIELFGGLALFLAARRVVSRMIGLLGFIAIMAAYSQGYTISDMILSLSSLLDGASVILQSLPIVQNA